MKKRMIALVLVITLVWGSVWDHLPLGRRIALAEEVSPASQTDLPADIQDTNESSGDLTGTERKRELEPELEPERKQERRPERKRERRPERKREPEPGQTREPGQERAPGRTMQQIRSRV